MTVSVAPSSPDLQRVADVPLELRVELGRTSATIAELLEMAPGHIVMLDRLVDSGVDLFAAERILGHGDVVAIDEEFGVRVVELHDSASTAGDALDEPPTAAWRTPDGPPAADGPSAS
jgi:flagellar motor switch protein FliN/FliY